jgi:hypothetical protein
MNKFSLQARRRCATFLPGAKNTKSEAVHLPVSEVFSCPKFKVLDVGRAYPQGWPQRFGAVLKPHVHPVDLRSQRMVSEFPEGIKTMQTTTPKMGTIPRYTSTSTAHPERLAITPAIDLLQRADNALAMARFHLRKQSSPEVIRLATGKAVSAARALKQACAEGGAL